MSKVDEFICYAQIMLPDLKTVLTNAANEKTLERARERIADAQGTVQILLEKSEAASAELGQTPR